MPNEAMTGAATVLLWTPDGGAEVELSVYGRDYSPEETSGVYNTTTYSEAQAGYETKIPGLKDKKASFKVMYQEGDTDLWDAIAPGTVGVLKERREGTGTGKPQDVRTGIITKRSKNAPYNEVSIVDLDFEFSGAPTLTPQA